MTKSPHDRRTLGPRRRRSTIALLTGAAVMLLTVMSTLTGTMPTAAATSDCNVGSGGGVFARGDGSATTPYEVTTSVQLIAIGTPDCLDEHYVQHADITLTGAWTPIGTPVAPFRGSYDGGNHAITGLSVTGASDLGLFGAITSATIERLTITGTVSASSRRAGLLAGAATASAITDLTVIGSVMGTEGLGGLVGQVQSSVQMVDVGNFATVVGIGRFGGVGGLIGDMTGDATIDAGLNHGAVTASASAMWGTGGFIGTLVGDATISASANHGHIAGSNDAGGFVGYQVGDLSTITAVNAGNIAATTNSGGFVGRLWGSTTITNGTNHGGVDAAYYAGGFIGNLISEATISASANNGTITGTSYVGGLIGLGNRGIVVTSSTNNGTVTGTSYVGGFVGAMSGNLFVDGGSNHGHVTSTALSGNAAGFVAELYGDASLHASANHGSISAQAASARAGGLIGHVHFQTTISASANHGTVTGGSAAGGIGAAMAGGSALLDVYSTGAVTATAGNAGGIVPNIANTTLAAAYVSGRVTAATGAGAIAATSTNSTVGATFFDSSLTFTAVGPGVDTALTRFSTFDAARWAIQPGWRAYETGVRVWGICPRANGGRPFLLWEYPADPCLTLPPAPPIVTTTTVPEEVVAISGLIDSADVVFLVASDAPADAVLAAAAGGTVGAPVLTATFDDVDGATLDELTRLGPDRIVLVGGERRLSASIEMLLTDRVPGAAVERLAGVNRINTAIEVSRRFHSEDAGTVFVVAADAPADAVLAAAKRSPVLFTRRGETPEVTLREIMRLEPENIRVVGGSSRIADSVLTGLQSAFPMATVRRSAGTDRYDTSAQLADPHSLEVLLVNGELASIAAFVAPALAATTERMLVLSRPECLPDTVSHLVVARSVTSIGSLVLDSCT